MPKQKAAFKDLRKSRKLYERHVTLKKRIKDLRKKAIKLGALHKFDEAAAIARNLQQALDKASRAGGFIKKNTAARIKSRLAAHIKRLKVAASK